MTYFLTSSPTIGRGGPLNPANGFVEELRAAVKPGCAALFLTSEPDDSAFTEQVSGNLRRAFSDAGLTFSAFDALDRRNMAEAERLVSGAGLIVLSGGHTPTENRFFRELGLRETLRRFDGVLVGISAGSMNCAETVYCHPELPGETTDPDYRRFVPGLGLTEKMILPHWQELKDATLDGKRLVEDVALPDSLGRTFYAIPDGSYLLGRDGREEFRGAAWRLADGTITALQ